MNTQPPVRPPSDAELLSTLFDLGREVTSVLDLEELLARIPQLIAKLTRFNAFAVYLLDEQRQELRIAYAVDYPEGAAATQRLAVGQGVVGAAVEEGRPILVNDIRHEPRYVGPLRNMLSQLAVPMRSKGKIIGALNLLSETPGAFTSQDEALLRACPMTSEIWLTATHRQRSVTYGARRLVHAVLDVTAGCRNYPARRFASNSRTAGTRSTGTFIAVCVVDS